MSKTIFLDPEKTASISPSTGDSRNGSWISVFDVPVRMDMVGAGKTIRSVKFSYPGGEAGGRRQPLDLESSPDIQIQVSRQTGKILQVDFGRPIDLDEVSGIADRIQSQSEFQMRESVGFNFALIAILLRQLPQVYSAGGWL